VAARSGGMLLVGLAVATALSACDAFRGTSEPVVDEETAFPDDGLAQTPPMGFNTFNRFFCRPDEQLVRDIADSMVSSGMRDAGYQYVVIDDCWQGWRDGATSRIVPDPQRFPGGMRALADYVHSRGLKFGLYTDAGWRTCQGLVGSYGFYDVDARTFAEWGVDYVKVDWCYADGLTARTQYGEFRTALLATGRPMVFSICEWGSTRPSEWARGIGHLWRTTPDIQDRWESMLANADASARYVRAAAPGGWNDPDMLEVGNGGMTADEYRVHFSLWAIMAAPLIAGNDIRTMPDSIREILVNREVIAVDQDSLGVQGIVVSQPSPDLQVWVKLLSDGSQAVALVNRSGTIADIAVGWSSLGLPTGTTASVRDLWARSDRGLHSDRFAAAVPPHGVVMVRIAGQPAR